MKPRQPKPKPPPSPAAYWYAEGLKYARGETAHVPEEVPPANVADWAAGVADGRRVEAQPRRRR